MTTAAAKSAAPRPGSRGCPASCITMSRSRIRSISTAWSVSCRGRAIGFVAAGGGSFGSAHVGIYKAFRERGVMFDIFVGTSVGSAMAAGFAKNFEADHLERGTHEIFVKSRSFRRPTWPRYALLDHKAFDRALADQYGANAGSRIAGGPLRRSPPIFRPIVSN